MCLQYFFSHSGKSEKPVHCSSRTLLTRCCLPEEGSSPAPRHVGPPATSSCFDLNSPPTCKHCQLPFVGTHNRAGSTAAGKPTESKPSVKYLIGLCVRHVMKIYSRSFKLAYIPHPDPDTGGTVGGCQVFHCPH